MAIEDDTKGKEHFCPAGCPQFIVLLFLPKLIRSGPVAFTAMHNVTEQL